MVGPIRISVGFGSRRCRLLSALDGVRFHCPRPGGLRDRRDDALLFKRDRAAAGPFVKGRGWRWRPPQPRSIWVRQPQLTLFDHELRSVSVLKRCLASSVGPRERTAVWWVDYGADDGDGKARGSDRVECGVTDAGGESGRPGRSGALAGRVAVSGESCAVELLLKSGPTMVGSAQVGDQVVDLSSVGAARSELAHLR